MTESNVIALNMSRERTASTASGYVMLFLLLVAILAQIWGIVQLANDRPSTLALVTVIVAPLALIFIACGFYMMMLPWVVSKMCPIAAVFE